MKDAYTIEVDGLTAGIVVSDGPGFRFHAADARFFGIDGYYYGAPVDAERGARTYLRKPRGAPARRRAR